MFEAVLNHVVANLHALCARSENGEKLSDAENAEFTSGACPISFFLYLPQFF